MKILIPLLFLLTSCTYSITLLHSKGSTDTLREQQEASPDVSTTLTAIPGV